MFLTFFCQIRKECDTGFQQGMKSDLSLGVIRSARILACQYFIRFHPIGIINWPCQRFPHGILQNILTFPKSHQSLIQHVIVRYDTLKMLSENLSDVNKPPDYALRMISTRSILRHLTSASEIRGTKACGHGSA